MPGMDGFEATAHAMKGDEERCRAAGMNAYLSKPVQAQQLYDVLARISHRLLAKAVLLWHN